jgi:hypothetical protein
MCAESREGIDSSDADVLKVDELAAALQSLCRPPNEPSVFDGVAVPAISLRDYLARLQRHAFLDETLMLSWIIIKRALEANPDFTVSSLNVHRVIMASAVVAAKFSSDFFYDNLFYAQVGGIRLTEMNRLEASMLSLVKWRLYVSAEEYEEHACPFMARPRPVLAPGAAFGRCQKGHSDMYVERSPGGRTWSRCSSTNASPMSTSKGPWTYDSPPSTPESTSSGDTGLVLYRSPVQATEMEID